MSVHPNNSAQMYKELKRIFLEREIANFYVFLKTLDAHLEGRQIELAQNIGIADSELKAVENDKEHHEELIDLKAEADQVKGFTNLLRQSFLTSLYSFMELWIMRQCYIDSKGRDGGQSYETIKGRGIKEAKRYFTRVMKSKYPFSSNQDWLWITNFQLLRNCIIHRQGSLTGFSDFEVDTTLAKFVKSEQGLSLFGVELIETYC